MSDRPTFSLRQSLALTAVVASLATTSVILTYQSLRRDYRTERLKEQVGRDVAEWEAKESENPSAPETPFDKPEWKWEGEYDESLIREQLTRNYSFLGDDSMRAIRNSYVVVVGCGGVGSWAATMLLRSGVGKILLIDYDLATLSSLNRHACATLEDVGTPKVVAMQKFFKKIAPWAQVDIKIGLWRKDESESWLEGADYVFDAIDNIDTKVDLLAHCRKNGIKVFASMGAGAKCDPTRVQIADISNTYEDPLARSVRRRLRLNGVHGGIPTVYSTEVPGQVKLLPLPEEEFQKGAVKELGAFDDFRVRILPVLGPLPALFGLHAATYIIMDLAGKPLEAAEIKNRRKLYTTLERNMSERQARVQHAKGENVQGLQRTLEVNADDMALVFEDVNRGRTTIPHQIITQRPQAVHWDVGKPLTADNMAILTDKDAKKHEKEVQIEGKNPADVWGADAAALVARRNAEVRSCLAYRRG
ncbi:hypothetical protein CcaverHIS002_0200580 [Cutaneotrichosporon cavernicola]|uniref:THIF-type NAD/FAD binding fold domain-containing protein n=1 Tax=Cutaneotrichosporon cavernicola TaxID=279322 RepID=A0AA48L0V0_9TREE|nr:uncharacterized protein CcaverHIS019_0200620 [Cutaneotrichosporon cavernicola]BEI80898.1 hypothetical protein CcaverHIS002_0200580 [Cutaneotrichosporon cavernicola]BEI88700.1 hypothetical protein CcaverHIS019_0200620 [Cutaneotrichosporon cavernicola]BEI96474.1 hypothetical protein CcaverHIS631_0200630 [Cutaneotrichosporon cavernicola]BEJ04246.1 hypothetical protein CcaverHIS641_0200630 [Cutaneotrichosporon cavernicola]